MPTTSPHPAENGEGGFRVMRNAMRDAGIAAHAGRLRQRPRHLHAARRRLETTAIKRAFGDHAYKMAVSSTKSMTGHLLGGAGGLEAGITVLAFATRSCPRP